MTTLKLIYVAVLGATVSEAAAAEGMPIAYYVATVSVVSAIYTVIRAWTWVQGQMKREVKNGFEAHRTEHQRIEDKIDAISRAIRAIPLSQLEMDRGNSDRPALTPVQEMLPITPEEIILRHHREAGK